MFAGRSASRQRPRWAVLGARAAAWGVLVGASAFLVRAEVREPGTPAGIIAYTEIVYRHDGGRAPRLDLYVPTDPIPTGGRPALIAIHGGGWCGGRKDGYGRLAAVFAQHGYVVAAIGYRLATPKEPAWPANLDDCRAAVRWVRRHAADYGIDPDRISALGASAGGHLAALLGTMPDGHDTRVAAVINFYGPTDLAAIVRQSPAARLPVARLLGADPDRNPGRTADGSPVTHVTGDDPPVLMFYGADDPTVRPDQGARLASALARAGVAHRLVIVPGVGHGFGFRVRRRDFVPEILAFLDEVWNHRAGLGRLCVP